MKSTIGAVWLVLLEGGIGLICSWKGSTWLNTGLKGDNNEVKGRDKTKEMKNFRQTTLLFILINFNIYNIIYTVYHNL